MFTSSWVYLIISGFVHVALKTSRTYPRSSAVLGIGAASLADIFEPHERGTKLGVYYIAPLLVRSAFAVPSYESNHSIGSRARPDLWRSTDAEVRLACAILVSSHDRRYKFAVFLTVLQRHVPSRA
jgi:hypothetical protein